MTSQPPIRLGANIVIGLYTHSEFSNAADDIAMQRYGFGAKYVLSPNASPSMPPLP